MTEMTWPDGEKLRYLYDNGGLLKTAWGEKKGNRYDYVKTLTYDEFGQRKYIEYGNGVKSTYAYDELTRRLAKLNTTLKDGREIQKLKYEYDLVGNVMNLNNGIEIPTSTALPAGPVAQKFTYDDLYQIVHAEGGYNFGPGKQNTYTNDFIYDTIGNFTQKKQEHKIYEPSTTTILPKETNYVLNYVYGSSKPHAVTDAGDKLYTYDPAGNMTGWTNKNNGTRRTITWNEENRVKQIDDNGKATYFLYDDAGERVVKRGQHGESIYVNRFYSVRNGELGTKHVFAGETRVVSKLVKTPNTVTSNSGTTATTTVISTTTSTIPGIQGLDNGRGKKLGIIKRLPDGYQVGINPPVEKDEFFYHGDHLGSSNMITDDAGAVYQHLEYFPYGETWVEEGGSSGNTPGYKFTGKELDPETGLYYYGARYYDPVLSKWISADPAIGKYLPNLLDNEQSDENWHPEQRLPGMGGVFNPVNISLYAYSHHNPIKFYDPDGESPVGWIIKLTEKGFQKVAPLFSKEAARAARKEGENVLVKNRQLAHEIEKSAAEGKEIIKHKGHDLPGGKKGKPHYQTEGKKGHTFWAGLGAFVGSLLDPFDVISGELANEDQIIQQTRSTSNIPKSVIAPSSIIDNRQLQNKQPGDNREISSRAGDSEGAPSSTPDTTSGSIISAPTIAPREW